VSPSPAVARYKRQSVLTKCNGDMASIRLKQAIVGTSSDFQGKLAQLQQTAQVTQRQHEAEIQRLMVCMGTCIAAMAAVPR
jgi:hypothetical protein